MRGMIVFVHLIWSMWHIFFKRSLTESSSSFQENTLDLERKVLFIFLSFYSSCKTLVSFCFVHGNAMPQVIAFTQCNEGLCISIICAYMVILYGFGIAFKFIVAVAYSEVVMPIIIQLSVPGSSINVIARSVILLCQLFHGLCDARRCGRRNEWSLHWH